MHAVGLIISYILALAINGVAAIQDGGPVTGELGNATIVENNPPGAVYKAVLPEDAFDKDAYPDGGNVKGEITAVASPDGIGVLVKVKFSNLPKEGGPFPYHLHVDPVPDDGNCTSTLAHLDPYIRGETYPCNSNLSQTCQVGDLSGKHGKIDSDPFEASYTEWYASTADGIGAFFGNRSFVVHFANKTRITCANFDKVDEPYPSDHGPVPDATTSACPGNKTVQAIVSTTSASLSPSGAASRNGTTPSSPASSTTAAQPTRSVVVTAGAVSHMRFVSGGAGMLAFAAAIMLVL